MNKIVIIIADQDPEFYRSLMVSLLEKYDDDTMSLFITTDQTHLDARIAMQQEVDIVLVNEAFYRPDQNWMKVRNTMVFTEHPDRDPGKEGLMFVHRYTRLQTLIHLIDSMVEEKRNAADNRKKQARVIMVTSTTGGVGKTSVALALTKQLNRHNKTALYLDAETIQDYNTYTGSDFVMSASAQQELIFSDGHRLSLLLEEIAHHDDLFYLPQMELALISYDKSLEIYANMINHLKEEGTFQYIVVDTEHVLDGIKTDLIEISDQLIMVTDASGQSLGKYRKLKESINIKDKSRLILNKTRPGQEKAGIEENAVMEIPLMEGSPQMLVEKISREDEFKELVYMII